MFACALKVCVQWLQGLTAKNRGRTDFVGTQVSCTACCRAQHVAFQSVHSLRSAATRAVWQGTATGWSARLHAGLVYAYNGLYTPACATPARQLKWALTCDLASSTSILAAGCATVILLRMVAPSFVMITSPLAAAT